ncbi:hypothetical protein PTKIN_Ptkin16aG0060100 [Pterospermum kingtungense]
MAEDKERLAVLVGCNYPNTKDELRGCINDVIAMRDLLLERFGFDPSHVEVFTDVPVPQTTGLATGANIKATLDKMVANAEAGDVLFFQFSGHGKLMRKVLSKCCFPPIKLSFSGHDAIVPCDFNLITDSDLRQLIVRLPPGVSFTIFSDSCHSGGLIDRKKVQIGPSTVEETTAPVYHKPRGISGESILEHLESFQIKVQGTSMENPETWSDIESRIGSLLWGLFGEDASVKYQPNLANDSARESQDQLSNRDLVMKARKVLEELPQGYGKHQHPCLYCSDENADAAFLGHPST